MDTYLSQEQLQKLSALQIQSLQILSMSSEELRSFLQKESEENPFLDYHPSTSPHPGITEFLHFVAAPDKDKIKKFIMDQLNPYHFTSQQWTLLTYLAQCVDDKGYLTITASNLSHYALTDDSISQAITILQSLNPPGIGASSLSECLKLQLQRSHELTPIAETIIDNFLEDLSQYRIHTICQALGLRKKQVLPVIQRIRTLDPAPLKGLFDDTASYIIPDIIINQTNQEYEIILNDSWTASYSISNYYITMMHKTNDPDIKSYFRQKYSRCSLLMHNIERRRQTLITLTQAIWEWQGEYISIHHSLRPMTLKDISQKTGFHTSTISRALKNKYVQTPYRTVPFKDLFQCPLRKNGYIFSKNILCQAIKELIDMEDKKNPYSDAHIVSLLSDRFHITISRRVVQKYRNQLHIPNSYLRKFILNSHDN